MPYQTRQYSKRTRGYLRKILPESIYLRHFGRHDKKSLSLWQSTAGKVPADSAILDIGAFHGEYALIARKVNKLVEIYAFEPNPKTLETLRPICKNNQINLVENAVSNEIKTSYFYCNNKISKIVKDKSDADIISIKTITLDTWSLINNKIPYLIKIDVESAAGDVLCGSRIILAKHRPIIICEILNDGIGAIAKDSLPPGYYYYYINENNGLELKKDIRRYDWRYLNWMFIPEEKKNLIQEFFIKTQ